MSTFVRMLYAFGALLLLGVSVILLSVDMPALVRNGVVVALFIGLHAVYRWHRDRPVPSATTRGSSDSGGGT